MTKVLNSGGSIPSTPVAGRKIWVQLRVCLFWPNSVEKETRKISVSKVTEDISSHSSDNRPRMETSYNVLQCALHYSMDKQPATFCCLYNCFDLTTSPMHLASAPPGRCLTNATCLHSGFLISTIVRYELKHPRTAGGTVIFKIKFRTILEHNFTMYHD
jgi:hypothetical protein